MPRSTTPDLRKYSPSQLEALISKAQKRRHELTTRRVDRVRTKIEALLKAEGLTLAEVFGPRPPQKGAAAAAKPRKFTVKPKYRNPSDAQQMWSGRGRAPRWFADAVAAGAKPEDLLIG